mgnify:CR=1 FL=1
MCYIFVETGQFVLMFSGILVLQSQSANVQMVAKVSKSVCLFD